MSGRTLRRRKKSLKLDLDGDFENALSEPAEESLDKSQKEAYFQNILGGASDADIKYEYDTFLRALPKSLPLSEKERLVNLVSDVLKIKEVKARLVSREADYTGGSFWNTQLGVYPLLDAMSAVLGFGWRILAPPTLMCLHYRGPLEVDVKSKDGQEICKTQVKLHTINR